MVVSWVATSAHDGILFQAGGPEDLTAAVDIREWPEEDWWSRLVYAADPHVSDCSGNGDPFLVNVEVGDAGGLNVVEDFSGSFGSQFVQERRFRSSVRKLLGGLPRGHACSSVSSYLSG